MAVGDIGVWRDNVGSQLPGTTFSTFLYPLEVRNDGEYTYLSGSIRVQSAGTYLVMYSVVTRNTLNDRLNYEAGVRRNGAFEVTGNNGFDAGYSRDLNNPYASARNICVKRLDALDTFAVAWRRGSTAGFNGSIPNACELVVIRLPDETPYGFLGSFPANSFNGQVWTDLGFYSQAAGNDPGSISYDSGTSDLILHGDERLYLVGYAVVGATGGTSPNDRTQRIGRVTADGTEIPHSFDHAYQRNNVNNKAVCSTTFLFKSKVGGGDRLRAQLQRGHAGNDGVWNTQVSWSGFWAIELPTSTEAYLAHDATGAIDLNNALANLNWSRTATVESASFSRVNNEAAGVLKSCDAIIIGNGIADRADEASAVRNVRGTTIYINGVGQTAGVGLGYLRGFNAAASTWQMAKFTHLFASLTAGQAVDLRSVAYGDQGVLTDETEPNHCGMALINVDTFFTPEITGSGGGSTAEATGLGDGKVDKHVGGGGGSTAEAFGLGDGKVAQHSGGGGGSSAVATGLGDGKIARHAGSGGGSTAVAVGYGIGSIIGQGAYEAFSRSVRDRWGTLVGDPAGIWVNYDNDWTAAPQGTALRAELRVMHDEAEELSRNGDRVCYRIQSRLRLRVFERVRKGDRNNIELIDATIAAFQGKIVDGVWYRSAGEVETRGRDTGKDSWWQHILEIECTRDVERVPAVSEGDYVYADLHTAQGTIRDYFGRNVEDALPITTIYDNDPVARVPTVAGEWIRHSIQIPAETIAGEAGPSGTLLRPGIAVAQVFIPVASSGSGGGGDRRLLELADTIVPLHSDLTVGGVKFGTAYLVSVGRDGPWWQGNVVMPVETVVQHGT